MHARLAAYEGGDTERLREMGEAQLASGSPFPAAVRRAFVLAAPDDERRLFITFFDDEEALAASEAAFDKMGEDVPEDLGGKRVALESYEVVLDWQA